MNVFAQAFVAVIPSLSSRAILPYYPVKARSCMNYQLYSLGLVTYYVYALSMILQIDIQSHLP